MRPVNFLVSHVDAQLAERLQGSLPDVGIIIIIELCEEGVAGMHRVGERTEAFRELIRLDGHVARIGAKTFSGVCFPNAIAGALLGSVRQRFKGEPKEAKYIEAIQLYFPGR